MKTIFSLIGMVLLASVLFVSRAGAQAFHFPAHENSEIRTATQIKAHGLNDTIIVWNAHWGNMRTNPTGWRNSFRFKSIHSFVKFYVDHSYPGKTDLAYTFRLSYQLRGYSNMADTNAYTTHNDTLTISYDPDSLASYQDIQAKKYSGYYKIMVVLTGLYQITNPQSAPQPVSLSTLSLLNFNVEGSVLWQAYHKSDYGIGSTLQIISDTMKNDYLELRWKLPSAPAYNESIKLEPVNYELEWTYVDDYRVGLSNGSIGAINKDSLTYNFRNNSTRVWLDTNYYRVPLIYQRGYLAYRVRMVRPDSVAYDYPVYSAWTTVADSGALTATGYRQISAPHMGDTMNWQYTISFAEQGKYKHVLGYFDGLLKNRQSLTRFNSDPSMLIVTGQVYDHEGRPSISVLPTPVSSKGFHYQHGLSRNQLTLTPYQAADFDLIYTDSCPSEVIPPPLAADALPNLYYSDGNTDTAGFQKFVPDAGGYPFVHTVYSPGNDQRVELQGGAGDRLQIGTHHETRNDYVNADQSWLNQLFGPDIGWKNFYRKTVTKDPNGQLSVQVNDYQGRIVASSMMGIPDTIGLAISRNENVQDSTLVGEDLLAGTIQQVIGNKRIVDHNFYMDVKAPGRARYVYNYTPLYVCEDRYLSVKAAFNFDIIDRCGNTVIDTGGVLGITGVMRSGAMASYSSPWYDTFMEQGKHSLHKELTIHLEDVYAAVDSFMADPGCLKSEPEFIRESVESKTFPCPPDDDEDCYLRKKRMLEELWPNRDGGYTARKYGFYEITDDIVAGNSNSVFTRFQVGEGGEYIYRYQDTCMVRLPAGYQTMPVDSFIAVFDDQIAEALLPLHPEYCKLLACFNDSFQKKVMAIPDAATAESLGLLRLSDLIAADPVAPRLAAAPLSFASVTDSLSFMRGGVTHIDSIALMTAYCSSGDQTLSMDCFARVFRDEIASGTLINAQVKDLYFKSMAPLYFANRERYKSYLTTAGAPGDSCAACMSKRMTLIPSPVFPDYFSADGQIIKDSGNYFSSFFIDTNYLSLEELLDLVHETIDSARAARLSDSARWVYDRYNSALCTEGVEAIISKLINCAPAAKLDSVRIYLQYLCATGQVKQGNYTPDQVHDALARYHISMDDLCNPYLAGYGNFRTGSSGSDMRCKPDEFYSSAVSLLNGAPLDALKNPGTEYALTLSAGLFDQALATVLGAAPHKARASYSAGDSLYRLALYNTGGDTVWIMLKGTGRCGSVFDSLNVMFSAVHCTREVLGSFASGYIGNFSFVTDVTFEGTKTCRLLGWNTGVEMNESGSGPLAGCIPCTQMRQLYTRFADTMRAYSVKGVDHVNYATMLQGFMNYSLQSSYTASDYIRFIESCALADSMRLPRYGAYAHLEFTSNAVARANAFLSALAAVDSKERLSPALYYTQGSTAHILLDIKQLSYKKMKLYRDFIRDYTDTDLTVKLNERFPDTAAGHMGLLFVQDGSFVGTSTAIFGAAPYPFFFSDSFMVVVRNGNVSVNFRCYEVTAPPGATHASVSANTGTLQRYLYQHGIPGIYLNTYESTADDDYTLPEKKAFLEYTYRHQQLSPARVLDSLAADNLEQRVSNYAGRGLAYGAPSSPFEVQHLHITGSNPSAGTCYDTLVKILNYVTGGLGSNRIFITGTSQSISAGGMSLTAYRCADGTYWFRYFGGGDKLYNVYVRMPDYIPQHEHAEYQLVSIIPNSGDSVSRSFRLTLSRSGFQIAVDGFTDFTVARNMRLKDVLLTHPLDMPYSVADTADNCERHLLHAAIYEGRVNYRLYIDSVRSALRDRFLAHVMDGVTEQLFLGYADQKFNYTLYYYDRAGNRIRTIPPEGVAWLTLGDTALSTRVDSFRRTATAATSAVRPAHTKPTVTWYNTLNQPFQEVTPDGGMTRYWYDAAGRQIFSQNARQQITGYYTYNLYDRQGRIVETGEARIGAAGFPNFVNDYGEYLSNLSPAYPFFSYPAPDHPGLTWISPHPSVVRNMPHVSMDDVIAYVRANNRRDVTLRIYDTAARPDLISIPGLSAQENLRKRISAVKYFESLTPLDTCQEHYTYASYYSYDIAGNVKTLMHDYPALKRVGQRYKRIDYDFDLVSGKVNMLSYNRSFPDQYYQRYSYDADNRIVETESSADGYIWKREAAYEYYKHGPLARLSLGDLRVQGVDFAYTIQGWLKAINGDLLDTASDPGHDGTTRSVHARDAFAMSLDYFNGDYQPVGRTALTHLAAAGKNLYNGNIVRSNTAIAPFEHLSAAYGYDQLNRLKKADYSTVDAINHALAGVTDYANRYRYDQDGNLLALQRTGNKLGGTPQTMDSFTYYYEPQTNRLRELTDGAPDAYQNDIKRYTNSSTSRYGYDATGNLVRDMVSGHDSITWTMGNKVRRVINHTAKSELDFVYDGNGNRVAKYYKQHADSNGGWRGNNEFYVHAADGNLLAVYREEEVYKTSRVSVLQTVRGDIVDRWGREIYINALEPLYPVGPFVNATISQAGTDEMFCTEVIGQHPVSFYTDNSASIRSQMHTAMGSDMSNLSRLVDYEQTGPGQILGTAVNEVFLADDQTLGAAVLDHFLYSSSMPLLSLQEMADASPAMFNGFVSHLNDLYSLGLEATDEHTAENLDYISGYLWDILPGDLYTVFRSLQSEYSPDFSLYCSRLAGNVDLMSDPLALSSVGAALIAYGDEGLLNGFYDYDNAASQDLLRQMNTNEDLLEVVYQWSPGEFIDRVVTKWDDEVIDSIVDVSGIDIYDYVQLLSGKIGDLLDQMNGNELSYWKYVTNEQSRHYYLSDHVLYGSSRLGVRKYWPLQYYTRWSDTGTVAAVVDTGWLNLRGPWYSLSYNDAIRDTSRWYAGNTATESYRLSHVLGQKRYELTNHLGNVQATVTDNRVMRDTGMLRRYIPMVHAAYDYYPFGMLMPGRYVEDTATRCMVVTTKRMVPRVEREPVMPGPGNVQPGPGTIVDPYSGGGVLFTTTGDPDLEFFYEFNADPTPSGDANPVFEVKFEDLSGMLSGQVCYITDIEHVEIYGVGVIDWDGSVSIEYEVPEAIPVHFWVHISGVMPYTVYGAWTEAYRQYTVKRPEDVSVLVCNDVKDQYKFGFNGAMKDNEVRGIGNSYDFKFRGYNPQTGRFTSPDPLHKQYPWNSTYAFAENDVIRAKDLEGLERLIVTGVNAELRTAKLTIKKDIEILRTNNLPNEYANIKSEKVRQNFERGNTTLYVKQLPSNGQSVEYITKRAWKKGTGYQLNVNYDVSTKVIDPKDASGYMQREAGLPSVVTTSSSPIRSDVGAIADADRINNTGVKLNPGFNKSLSAEDVITHEVGIHNMAGVKHATDASGESIYPAAGLESNQSGNIYPTQSDTKQIISENAQRGRVENGTN